MSFVETEDHGLAAEFDAPAGTPVLLHKGGTLSQDGDAFLVTHSDGTTSRFENLEISHELQNDLATGRTGGLIGYTGDAASGRLRYTYSGGRRDTDLRQLLVGPQLEGEELEEFRRRVGEWSPLLDD